MSAFRMIVTKAIATANQNTENIIRSQWELKVKIALWQTPNFSFFLFIFHCLQEAKPDDLDRPYPDFVEIHWRIMWIHWKVFTNAIKVTQLLIGLFNQLTSCYSNPV